MRPLTIGAESGGMTVIKSGLAVNERVVTSNQYRLQPGVLVRDNAAGAPGGANAVAGTSAAAPAKTS
jgi:hypothetical protein